MVMTSILGVVKVLDRIAEINKKYAPKTVQSAPKADFKAQLEKAQNSQSEINPQAKINTNNNPKLADRNYNEIQQIIETTARKYGVDENFVKAVAKTESNFNPNATSNAGAMGIMQLMPSTAQELGVRNPYNPQENIDGGVRYLKKMLDNFGGNTNLALVAYNAGMATANNYGTNPPQQETKDYVDKVFANMRG